MLRKPFLIGLITLLVLFVGVTQTNSARAHQGDGLGTDVLHICIEDDGDVEFEGPEGSCEEDETTAHLSFSNGGPFIVQADVQTSGNFIAPTGGFIAGATTTYSDGFITLSTGTDLDIDNGTLVITESQFDPPDTASIRAVGIGLEGTAPNFARLEVAVLSTSNAAEFTNTIRAINRIGSTSIVGISNQPPGDPTPAGTGVEGRGGGVGVVGRGGTGVIGIGGSGVNGVGVEGDTTLGTVFLASTNGGTAFKASMGAGTIFVAETGGVGPSAEKFRIDNNGDTSIGLAGAAPSAKLGVLNSSGQGIHSTGSSFGVRGVTTGTAAGLYGQATGSGAGVQAQSASGPIINGLDSGFATVFQVTQAGDVFATGANLIASDARLKTNIEQLTGVLEKLEQVRGVSYERIDREGSDRNIGVIAQELEAVFPELVSTWGDDGYKAVAYGNMTAVLIEAVKELNAENKDLQARLGDLEQAAGIDGTTAEPMSSGILNPWFLLSGLAMAGLVLGGFVTVKLSRRGETE